MMVFGIEYDIVAWNLLRWRFVTAQRHSSVQVCTKNKTTTDGYCIFFNIPTVTIVAESIIGVITLRIVAAVRRSAPHSNSLAFLKVTTPNF